MPVQSSKLGHAKIYGIRFGGKVIYVGSTTDPLYKRMSNHRSAARGGSEKGRLHDAMRAAGVDAFKIEMIEEFPCGSHKELLEREGFWARELKTHGGEGLNVCLPGMSCKEYSKEY